MLIESSNNIVKFGKEGRGWFLSRVNMASAIKLAMAIT